MPYPLLVCLYCGPAPGFPKKSFAAHICARSALARSTDIFVRGHDYDGALVSRLRAHGNVHAQFGAALRGEFDLGARARGGWAGLCENEAPAMDPLKRVLTKCTPVARTPGAPVRPRGNAHINFGGHLGNEPDPGHGARRKLHAPMISLENHVCAKTPLLPPRVLPRDLR